MTDNAQLLSVEKIGGTSMSDYATVRDNIFKATPEHLYNRIFVVSAYGGMTDRLLEHKKTEHPGIYALFIDADDEDEWRNELHSLRGYIHNLNAELFSDKEWLERANNFIDQRLDDAENVLDNLRDLCRHGHFELEDHLLTIREMLASIGEAHSAWNTAHLLQLDGINARFVDLSGWKSQETWPLDELIVRTFKDIDPSKELPIVTGYAHCNEGLMATFDRGYSEMTFSRIVVMMQAHEAIIHKEYHLSSADPTVVGDEQTVPIGRTNYDVADQLANLGMEAIHPRAAKGLRQNNISLRIKNTFEPEHQGTLITRDYLSSDPCVEIIAGRKNLHAIELFDQDMVGTGDEYEKTLLDTFRRFHAQVVTMDINANTITHYLSCNLKTVRRIVKVLKERYTSAEITTRKVAIVSAIGSYMKVPGLLAKAVRSLADASISIVAMHQSMRQVDIQFIIDGDSYQDTIRALHKSLIEPHDYGDAICTV
ncbi:MAG: aspartate kinase [Gammaproteobacteria bacterium]|jgi:aspartate kinase|nr:aspartate kinase [Gammaproteobacteria bacterium]